MRHNSFLYQCPPGIIIFTSLLIAILVGTFFLSFGITHHKPIALIDLLFTATSALCATGFFTVSLDQFTIFGQSILLTLIQVGGLGLVTLTLFFVYSFAHLDLSTNLMASKLLDMDSWRDIRKILSFICILTLTTELLGSLLLLPFFMNYYSITHAFFLSLFHSISAFCNAGTWLLPEAMISKIGSSISVLIVLGTLLFIGGLGFITWHELWTYYTQKTARTHISLQTKLTIIGSLISTILIAFLFMTLEWNYSMRGEGFSLIHIMQSLFHGVSLRSSGFTFCPIEQHHPATLFLMMISGFVGSGSFSTGSGIKITTLILIFFTLKTIVTGRSEVEIQGRAIPYEQVNKSIAILLFSLFWIIISTFLLLIIEPSYSLDKILFAITMAYSNLGVFSQTIGTFSLYGKLIIIATMVIGRVGPLTLIIGLMVKKKRIIDFSYPEERIMLS